MAANDFLILYVDVVLASIWSPNNVKTEVLKQNYLLNMNEYA